MARSSGSRRGNNVLLGILCGVVAFIPSDLVADVTCVTATNKSVNGKSVPYLSTIKRSGKCRKGEVSALSGPTGKDGSLRIYGDGSAGAFNLSEGGGVFFTDYATDRNTQFTSFTIADGAGITVPGGAILRATGDVTIAGSLGVSAPNFGGITYAKSNLFPGALGGGPAFRIAATGIASAPAGSGEFGSNLAERIGGSGGLRAIGLINSLGTHLLRGGGGGAPGAMSSTGGAGGGSLMIVAKGTITIASTALVSADGAQSLDSNSGAGGGAGGVIVLVSRTAIVKEGIVRANGADGMAGGSQAAAGGGGGGGLIMLVAPIISDSGLTGVVGGAGGNSVAVGTITQTNRVGGGGGGASAGNGGSGASALVNGACVLGEHGDQGKVIKIETDPTAMF